MTINREEYFEWYKIVYLEVADYHRKLRSGTRPNHDTLRDLFNCSCSEYWFEWNEDLSSILPKDEQIPPEMRLTGIQTMTSQLINDWSLDQRGRHALECTDVLTSILKDNGLPMRTRMLSDLHIPALGIWLNPHHKGTALSKQQIGDTLLELSLDKKQPEHIRSKLFNHLTTLVTNKSLPFSEEYLQAANDLSEEPEFSANAYRMRLYHFEKANLFREKDEFSSLMQKINVTPR